MKMTGNNVSSFELLDDRIKRYVTNRLGWGSLTSIQEQSIPVIKEGNDTLVISPTASGKTEAVLLPIFDDIIHNDLEPLSVIYVSPLKALINDMHDRIGQWCEYFNFSVMKWHGDVNASKKRSFLKNPTDFLLITPESLEVIFMNKSKEEKRKIFKNLKYIIVDEIHYFVESDRGTQLNSLLNRISNYTNNSVVRVGLSATVGNPEKVLDWLKSSQKAEIVKDIAKRPVTFKVRCGLDTNICDILKNYANDKVLIFVHSRKDAERYYKILKKELKLRNIYVHHSSIDKEGREESEYKFKQESGFMISTSTLELGIDIGDIDIVAQISPPTNVSSFLQRIGRSGRRSNNIQKSIIFYRCDQEIFTALSEISLIKEGIIEDIKIPDKPKDIYFHQILSTIFEKRRIKKKDLFYYLKNCYSFSKIDKSEFKNIIKGMEEKEYVDSRSGYLSLGVNFEKKFGKRNFFDFYSVFCPNYEYKVKEGVLTVGTLDSFFVIHFLKEGNPFILGGVPWETIKIDHNRFIVKVKSITRKDADIPRWFTDSGVLDYLITRRIYEILLGNYTEHLKYFDNYSQIKVQEYIEHAQNIGFRKGIIPVEFVSRRNRVYIYTFAGLRVNTLLSTIFSIYHDIENPRNSPYFASFKFKDKLNLNDINNIMLNLDDIFKKQDIYDLINEITEKFVKNKFIHHLPYEDHVELKMELIYNKQDLIRLTKENTAEIIEYSKFKDWECKFYKENGEKLFDNQH